MRYVSKLLRSKITEAKTQDQFAQKVYSIEIKKNFWGYVKFYIEKPKCIIPNFDKKTCFDYFVKSFKCINPLKQFQIPSWIPTFREPLSCFDLNPPSYAEMMQSYKADEIERFLVSFASDLNHMLKKMPVSTHVHHRNLCKSLGNKSYSVILEESSQYINLQKGFHRQSSELLTNYSRVSRIKNLYVISTQQKMCILTSK